MNSEVSWAVLWNRTCSSELFYAESDVLEVVEKRRNDVRATAMFLGTFPCQILVTLGWTRAQYEHICTKMHGPLTVLDNGIPFGATERS